MPDFDEKLRRFTETITSDAAADTQVILEEVRQRRESARRGAEDDALEESYRYIKQEIARVRTENGRRVARRQMECKRLLFARRAELSQGVLLSVRERVQAYVQTPGYADRLADMARQAVDVLGEAGEAGEAGASVGSPTGAEEYAPVGAPTDTSVGSPTGALGSPVVVSLRHADMPLAPALTAAVCGRAEFRGDSAIQLGGLTAKAANRRLNLTFDANFEDWKEKFFAEIMI
ncbi:MAG: hypothetical protein FWE59_00345 [Oscillospiraceae bacterium]|nr:hypothetical protein [Oscillospiraceae bacterium]